MRSSLNGVRVSKPRREKSAGHVANMEGRREKSVLVLEVKTEGKKFVGRPRRE
jgi:hypothetical protein